MPPPRTYKTEAIVLKGTRLREADKVLTLFTPSLGKVRALARGLLRPRSKLAGHLEPLTRTYLGLAQGRGLDVITQAQAQDSFPSLRSSLERAAQAFYIVELVDRLTAEGQENSAVYSLLLEALGYLNGAQGVGLALRSFEVHLLGLAGFRPELSRCLECRAPLKPGPNFFALGGALCPGCRSAEARPLSWAALKVLRYLQEAGFSRGARVAAADELAAEVEGLLQGYIQQVLEGRVKSAAFLERLRREGVTASGSPHTRRYIEGPS